MGCSGCASNWGWSIVSSSSEARTNRSAAAPRAKPCHSKARGKEQPSCSTAFWTPPVTQIGLFPGLDFDLAALGLLALHGLLYRIEGQPGRLPPAAVRGAHSTSISIRGSLERLEHLMRSGLGRS